ncbi:non-homologous end-joining DNA ligase [Corynebacterium variabile]|uniref:non-homologous end-joining DNA ligase n=1 Tax=Corynebacterium variabile TaxID=1727 RepID=UPI003F9513E5
MADTDTTNTTDTVDVAGRTVRFTHPDKVMYPATGTTKHDLLDYARAVAPWFTAHAHDRPATRKRWVDGAGTAADPGESFFERNLRDGTPEWVRTREFVHESRTVTYPLVNDAATLVWLMQLDALEIHTPQWRYGPRGGIHGPDRAVFDLDPGKDATLADCAEVAHLVKEKLDTRDLVSVPVTTGSRGIHVYAGLAGDHRPSVVRDLVHSIADEIAQEHPDLVTSTMSREKRQGKVLIDWSQNDGVNCTCAPYSLRGRSQPTVAAPRYWEEIDADVRQLGYRQIMERLLTDGDPMASLLGPDDSGPAFVIQEHDATSLHQDFRLEHDGVLVSWALPKGVPETTEQDRLAVQTPDHPLEYASFEGRIGEGKPGAGTVTIRDAGSYVLHSWDEDKIVVTLHGRRGRRGRRGHGNRLLGGEPQKFALIRTELEGNPDNWLMHRMTE